MGAAALEEAVSMVKHAQSTALPREPRPPRCSRFSGSLIPPKAAPAPSPSSHLGGNPVKSILPGLLLHQLLKQRLALNNSLAFQKVSLPFGMASPTPRSLPRCHREAGGTVPAWPGCMWRKDLAGGIISAEIPPLPLGFVIVLAINFIKWSLLFSYYGTS